MSTQTSSLELPMTLSNSQQNLRLVELPPDLLDLLSAPRPPRLFLKSSAPGITYGETGLSSPARKAAEHLHLCTPTQSYQVRQVSTSNSVYVIEPSASRPAAKDGDVGMELDSELAQSSGAMTAFAKVDTMLELLPLSQDVCAMLECVLPVYDASGVSSAEEAMSCFLSHSTAASKEALFSDIPAPDAQSEQVWLDLLAFEYGGRCARPSAATSLGVWQSIINYTTLERLDLGGDVDLEHYFQTELSSPVDAPVTEAILSYLGYTTSSNSMSHSLQLNRPKMVRWTGLTLLQANSEKASSSPLLLKDDYISQWQDLLPEAWRQDVTLDKLLESCYTVEVVEGKEMISWARLNGSAPEPATIAVSQATNTTSGKRKWHEMFKAQRKESKK